MNLNKLRIGFIGGGKIAQALAKGFIKAGFSKGEHIVASCHPSDKASAQAFQELGAKSFFENIPVVDQSDVLIVAVKPSVVSVALSDIKNSTGIKTDKLFLSLAMGISLKQLRQYLPTNSRIIRIMPNTPALVNSGASVFVPSSGVTERDVAITKTLLKSVGTCEEVTEDMLNVVTALSASGPAYVYVLIESLADGAVKMGMPRDLAYKLASQTVLGAATMVRDTKLHPAILKDDVTSPAGSTAAGLSFLEKNGFRAALIGAIEEATNKCVEVNQLLK